MSGFLGVNRLENGTLISVDKQIRVSIVPPSCPGTHAWGVNNALSEAAGDRQPATPALESSVLDRRQRTRNSEEENGNVRSHQDRR